MRGYTTLPVGEHEDREEEGVYDRPAIAKLRLFIKGLKV